MAFGDNVRRLRIERGLTQAQLAKAAGISSVKMIETGRQENPLFRTVDAIARALGVSSRELVSDAPHVGAGGAREAAQPDHDRAGSPNNPKRMTSRGTGAADR